MGEEMSNKLSLLAVDDDVAFLKQIGSLLGSLYSLKLAGNASEAMAALKVQDFDGIILDMDMPEVSGLQLLKILRGLKAHIPVLMLTGNRSASSIVTAIKEGAFDYVIKDPSDMATELEFRVSRMLAQKALNLRAGKLEKLEKKIADEKSRKYEIVGHSAQTLKLGTLINQLKGYQTPVLILGESGTGKELIARALNAQESETHDRPFIAVNCGAIPENLIESELFGHEKGAFTGAIQRKDGKFLAAQGGDIFLDEIADLPLSAQAKLLRVLQEKEVTRVGSNDVIPINVRIIAATHKDLKQAVVSGAFREDLYYRLAVMSLVSPALRERREDIRLLVEHFLGDLRTSLKMTADAFSVLEKHDWPGNIRALKNCVERATILTQVDGVPRIEARHIQLDSMLRPKEKVNELVVPADLLPQTLEDVTKARSIEITHWAESIFYSKAFALVGENKSRLAEKLDFSRDYIHRKLKETGVTEEADR